MADQCVDVWFNSRKCVSMIHFIYNLKKKKTSGKRILLCSTSCQKLLQQMVSNRTQLIIYYAAFHAIISVHLDLPLWSLFWLIFFFLNIDFVSLNKCSCKWSNNVKTPCVRATTHRQQFHKERRFYDQCYVHFLECHTNFLINVCVWFNKKEKTHMIALFQCHWPWKCTSACKKTLQQESVMKFFHLHFYTINFFFFFYWSFILRLHPSEPLCASGSACG